jgi:hypothetical protein
VLQPQTCVDQRLEQYRQGAMAPAHTPPDPPLTQTRASVGSLCSAIPTVQYGRPLSHVAGKRSHEAQVCADVYEAAARTQDSPDLVDCAWPVVHVSVDEPRDNCVERLIHEGAP